MSAEAEFLALNAHVSELEDRLNLDYLDPNADPTLAPQVQSALRTGNKIEAIQV
jgi:hypothetical protein